MVLSISKFFEYFERWVFVQQCAYSQSSRGHARPATLCSASSLSLISVSRCLAATNPVRRRQSIASISPPPHQTARFVRSAGSALPSGGQSRASFAPGCCRRVLRRRVFCARTLYSCLTSCAAVINSKRVAAMDRAGDSGTLSLPQAAGGREHREKLKFVRIGQ